MHIVLTDEIKTYLKSLTRPGELAQAYRYFERQQELAYRLKGPVSKPLRDGINEIRPGPHRFLFFYHGRQIIIVHAFRKKSRATPAREIDQAIKKRALCLNEEETK